MTIKFSVVIKGKKIQWRLDFYLWICRLLSLAHCRRKGKVQDLSYLKPCSSCTFRSSIQSLPFRFPRINCSILGDRRLCSCLGEFVAFTSQILSQPSVMSRYLDIGPCSLFKILWTETKKERKKKRLHLSGLFSSPPAISTLAIMDTKW